MYVHLHEASLPTRVTDPRLTLVCSPWLPCYLGPFRPEPVPVSPVESNSAAIMSVYCCSPLQGSAQIAAASRAGSFWATATAQCAGNSPCSPHRLQLQLQLVAVRRMSPKTRKCERCQHICVLLSPNLRRVLPPSKHRPTTSWQAEIHNTPLPLRILASQRALGLKASVRSRQVGSSVRKMQRSWKC